MTRLWSKAMDLVLLARHDPLRPRVLALKRASPCRMPSRCLDKPVTPRMRGVFTNLQTPLSTQTAPPSLRRDGNLATKSSTQPTLVRVRQRLKGDILQISEAAPQLVHLEEHVQPGRQPCLQAAGQPQPEAGRRRGLAVASPCPACQHRRPPWAAVAGWSPSSPCRAPRVAATTCQGTDLRTRLMSVHTHLTHPVK